MEWGLVEVVKSQKETPPQRDGGGGVYGSRMGPAEHAAAHVA